MDLEKTKIQEILRLHSEVGNHLRQCLDKAIRIGQLLAEQKQILKHGEFTPWLESNIPFTDRTARNYMRLYRDKDKLKTETVSGLKEAYALLAPPKEESPDFFDAEAWGEIIKNINDEFFHNLKEYQIDSKSEPFFPSDGSLTEDQQSGFALWVNFHTHLCYWINFAKTKGKDTLHPQMRRYLDAAMEEKPNWINEPFKMICEKCHFEGRW